MGRKLSRIRIERLSRACLVVACLAAGFVRPAAAQANFDRPGGDYTSAPIESGDPADCALLCEHDRRCRAWSFNYPTVLESRAVCWLKSTVPPRVPDNCCVSGVRGAGVVEVRNGAVETAIDRPGGDYRSFEIRGVDGKATEKAAERGIEKGADKTGDKAGEKSVDRSGEKSIDKAAEKAGERRADAEDLCKATCAADNKCRAWTFARPGYAGKEAHCFLKKEIKPPRRRAGFTSGVLR
jgi:hypothetical protein